METILYKNWEVKGDQIKFAIDSIRNKILSTNNVTYLIEKYLIKNSFSMMDVVINIPIQRLNQLQTF